MVTTIVRSSPGSSEDRVLPINATFHAQDSLAQPSDPRADALECLKGLCWIPAAFDLHCLPPQVIGIDAILQFRSAKPLGISQDAPSPSNGMPSPMTEVCVTQPRSVYREPTTLPPLNENSRVSGSHSAFRVTRLNACAFFSDFLIGE